MVIIGVAGPVLHSAVAAQVSGSLEKEDKDHECKTSNWFSNKGW